MKLYNTMTGRKEKFEPLDPREVKIYSCGPTVYNYFHIGNARPFIMFDVLRRYLEYRGYDVVFVQNFTDIDDKMISRAKEENTTVRELADRFIQEYYVDAKGLGIGEATFHPRATDNIEAIIELISKLEQKGFAYTAGGDVYFRTGKYKDYGKLSHQSQEDLEVGFRVNLDERKENPMDFVLWKAQKPGEPAWDSPWGKGRPGWHIECSAMANKYLGETIDIHSGGRDLIFPHHENEIAQSEAANAKPFSRYWIHNGFINVDGEKMAKSRGNFFTVRDISKKFDYEVIRFFMLSAHYRNPINFSEELLGQAENGLERIYNCLDNLEYLMEHIDEDRDITENEIKMRLIDFKEQFTGAMDDDLNTADALAGLFNIIKEVNTNIGLGTNPSRGIVRFAYSLIKELGGILGIGQKNRKNDIDSKIQELINKRQQARKEKDWGKADQIRETLKDMGVTLEDTPQGVKVHIDEQ
ncbi:MAG: cysteine--tRNA ligase [Clostridium sp.]|mgnify:CR=1 FL=1|nr:cysteine--tRNA ligase [Clostridium sp.]